MSKQSFGDIMESVIIVNGSYACRFFIEGCRRYRGCIRKEKEWWEDMLSIAVCDDEIRECCRLSTMIREFLEERGLSCSLRRFRSGRDLLNAAEKFDLIFLDILMEGVDGMETARRLWERESGSLLVFVSSSRDYVFEAYDVEAFQYLLKPVEAEKLKQVLLRALLKLKKHPQEFLVIQKDRQKRKLFLDDILYFEIRGRVIEAHGTEAVFSYYGQIGLLEQSLKGKGFFRCHKGYLVNLRHVDGYDRQEAFLDNGERLVIAKRRWEEFGKELLAFMRQEGGLL